MSYLHGVVSCRKPHSIWYAVSPFWGYPDRLLGAIFTGPKAEKVSGKALASLNADQLQTKLDWLVKMRIIERSQSRSNRPLYTIHPAVRDGYLGGISRDINQVSHAAIRQGLEFSLGEIPGSAPSDSETLDLLEEIVHHALATGRKSEAWEIYQQRIGGYENLGWKLSAYERGIRISNAFLRNTAMNLISEWLTTDETQKVEQIAEATELKGLDSVSLLASTFAVMRGVRGH